MKKHKILIVDDNTVTTTMFRETLEHAGHDVCQANTAETALAQIKKNQPDIIVLEQSLPDMDGIELAKKIFARSENNKADIILMTSITSKIEEARLSGIYFPAILLKPVDMPSLLNAINKTTSLYQIAVEKKGAGRHILIVDEVANQLKLIRKQLQNMGFQITVVTDGLLALRQLSTAKFDAVVSLVLMHGMDGFELCYKIRKNKATANIPVILISAYYIETEDQQLAKKVGANYLINRIPGPEQKYLEFADHEFIKKVGDHYLINRLPKVEQLIATAVLDSSYSKNATATTAEPHLSKTEHTQRIIHQLENQLTLNANLSQRCAIQAAQLTFLSNITHSLPKTSKQKTALDDILTICIDAAGISHGVLYILSHNKLLFEKAIGFKRDALDEVKTFFKNKALFEHVIKTKTILAIPSSSITAEATESLLKAAKIDSGLILPLLNDNQTFGVLFLGSCVLNFTEPDLLRFAESISSQIAQSLKVIFTYSQLKFSEFRYRTLMENATCGLILLNTSGKILEINRAAETIYGTDHKHLIGKKISKFVAPSEKALRLRQFKKLLIDQRIRVDDVNMLRHDGTIRTVNISATVLTLNKQKHIYMVVDDITEQKLFKRQTQIHDRLLMTGTLTAGIAHEINNPASYVYSNLDFMQQQLETLKTYQPQIAAPEYTEMITEMLNVTKESIVGMERIREIVNSLKGITTFDDSENKLVDIHEIIESAIRVIYHEIKYKAQLKKDYAENLPKFLINPSKLQQIMTDLLLNAAQAIEPNHVDKNQITIKTLKKKLTIEIIITDTGCGIPEDILTRIFDPFFSTKPIGEGTGLGLSSSYDIIRSYNGTINVDSTVGKGTTFTVSLPINNEGLQNDLTVSPLTKKIEKP